MNVIEIFNKYKVAHINGRYITLNHIESFLKNLKKGDLKVIGQSVQNRLIYQYTVGSGKVNILMWSQMHGNESTTTKAVIDLLNLLEDDSELASEILATYTLTIIPMLNPDGAFLYTRSNAVEVDLNRDSQNLTQPESQILKSVYTSLKPDFGFNLHDQRTIFGAGNTNNPATVSFLSPSYNENRDVNEVRKKAMSVILAMNDVLQKHIPGQVGRFDDGFNLNCIGDTLQFNGIPTILFESGHYPNDYQREETRKYIFTAIFSALKKITEIDYSVNPVSKYEEIPQNNTDFYDVIITNVGVEENKNKKYTTFGLQYKEVLVNSSIEFVAYVAEIGELIGKKAHLAIDGKQILLKSLPEIGEIANLELGDYKFIQGKLNN